MTNPPTRVTSDLPNPMLGALHVALLPIWGLLLASQLTNGKGFGPITGLYALLVLLAVPQFFRGLILMRQRVEADAGGITVRGLGGFHLDWADVASLTHRPRQRGGNVIVGTAGVEVPSDLVLLRTTTRRVGVAPELVDSLFALAAAHGVRTE